MGFEKGHNKAGGRTKGVKNKTTLLGRDIIENYFIKEKGLENLLVEIAGMEYDRDRVQAKIKLLEFFIPKQKETTIEQTNKLPEFDLSKLTDEELRKYIELANKCATDTGGDSEA